MRVSKLERLVPPGWPMPGANCLHQVSRRMVDENQAIVTETRNVRGMMRNRCLARAIADAGWGELRRQIACKAPWARRTHIEVDPWFPSTRRCSVCHAQREGLTLTQRRWRCETATSTRRAISATKRRACSPDNGRRDPVGQCAWRVTPPGCSRLDPGVVRYPMKHERTPRGQSGMQPPKPREGPTPTW